MKRKVLILTILLALISIAVGCNQKVEANEEKLLKFLSTLQGEKYEIKDYTDDFKDYSVNKDGFAQKFYEDFISAKIEFINPEYRTDNINDSKLQIYLSKYPKFKFILARTKKVEDEYMIFNIKYPNYNFKVYQIDFDNNKKNGKEDVFYSSGYWSEEELSKRAVYDVLNKKEIKDSYQETKHRIGGEVLEAEYTGKDKKRTKNYNGVIKYEDRYYIYEVLNWDSMIIIDAYCWNQKANKVLCILDYTIEMEEN